MIARLRILGYIYIYTYHFDASPSTDEVEVTVIWKGIKKLVDFDIQSEVRRLSLPIFQQSSEPTI